MTFVVCQQFSSHVRCLLYTAVGYMTLEVCVVGNCLSDVDTYYQHAVVNLWSLFLCLWSTFLFPHLIFPLLNKNKEKIIRLNLNWNWTHVYWNLKVIYKNLKKKTKSNISISEWVSNCYPMPNEQFSVTSWQKQITFVEMVMMSAS